MSRIARPPLGSSGFPRRARTVATLTVLPVVGVAVPALILAGPSAGAAVPTVTGRQVALDLPTVRAMVEADGHLFLAASNSIVVLAPDGTTVRTVTGMSRPTDLAASADGSTVYVASQDADAVALLDTATFTVRSSWPTRACPRQLALTADHMVYSHGCATWEGEVSVIDLTTGEEIDQGTTRQGFYSPPLIAAAGDAVVAVETGLSPTSMYSFAVTADGLTPGTSVRLESGYPSDVVGSPDRPRIATASGSPQSAEWDPATLRRRATLDAPVATTAVAYAPDGNTLATGLSGDLREGAPWLYLFDVTSQEAVLAGVVGADTPVREAAVVEGTLTVAGDGSAVYGVARNPSDQQWLVSAALPTTAPSPTTAVPTATAEIPTPTTAVPTAPTAVQTPTTAVPTAPSTPDATPRTTVPVLTIPGSTGRTITPITPTLALTIS